MSNSIAPYLIDGPAVISFSGGRSSAYMLTQIVRAHGGELPNDVRVAFSNTGKEMPETLDFVNAVGEHLGIEIVWLEYADHDEPQARWKIVSYKTAARDGRPFTEMMDRKRYLPNPIRRICTIELKIRPMKLWAQQALGFVDWTVVLGLRADEPRRLARIGTTRDGFETVAPMAAAGATKETVTAFWAEQNYDLRLANLNGWTPLGNCDLCFLKTVNTIQRIIRDDPARAEWWIAAEAKAEARRGIPSGTRFRLDRPSYADILSAVQRQDEFDFGEADVSLSCVTCDVDDDTDPA